MKRIETSWEKVSDWYGKSVGREGSYYHQHVVLPNSLRLLDLKPRSSLLDLACGQGVLARHVPETVHYVGVDAAPALIEQAKRLDQNRGHVYLVGDVSGRLSIERKDFSHAAVLLALQNIKNPKGVIENAGKHLAPRGRLLIVINHPCFRIHRQSAWEVDKEAKIQYRRINRYLTPTEVPIEAHPGRGEKSEHTWSYHFPLSEYSRMLAEAGFVIARIEEWISDKQSTGKAARMENRARREIPLFMALLCRKD